MVDDLLFKSLLEALGVDSDSAAASSIRAVPLAAAMTFRAAVKQLYAAVQYAQDVLEKDRPSNIRLTEAMDALRALDYHPTNTLKIYRERTDG